MGHKFTILIEKEDKFHIAKCLELGITSQGKTHGEALDNIREAVELFLQENPKPQKKQVVLATVDVNDGKLERK